MILHNYHIHACMYSILHMNILPAGMISHTYVHMYSCICVFPTDEFIQYTEFYPLIFFAQKHIAKVEQGTIVGVRGHIGTVSRFSLHPQLGLAKISA